MFMETLLINGERHDKKFSDLDNITQEKFDCVIFDLGVSSFQLKNMSRGFSFNSKEASLEIHAK